MEPDEYPKEPGAGGSKGTDYEQLLLAYALLSGYTNNDEFKLSTGNKKAGNFDDVVYETLTKKGAVLLQSKHKKEGISFNDLFPNSNSKKEDNKEETKEEIKEEKKKEKNKETKKGKQKETKKEKKNEKKEASTNVEGASLDTESTSKSRFIDMKGSPSAIQRPYFDDVGPRNVTAVVGQSSLLNCRVKHPGDRTVSWMRKRDLHILTSGIHTYTGDARFSVRHPEHSDDWDLRIEYVQKRDGGVYECQVNTEPKINLAIMLNVDDAQASISGPPEVYVKKGSTISLTCTVNVHSTPPSSILWYHGHSVVDFDSPRGGISLETEKTEAGTTSKLLVTKALLSDTGNYTCMPSNASPASTVVHVLNGEHPAAMQTSRAAPHHQMALLASLLCTITAATLTR